MTTRIAARDPGQGAPDARRKTIRQTTIVLTALASAALAMAGTPSGRPWLVWNVSESAPRGLYAVGSAAPLFRGELLAVRPATGVASFAAARGYLPLGIPLVKRIAAGPGDRVCATRTGIVINDRAIAQRLREDSHGRALPAWSGCETLRDGEIFLLMADVPTSFDGRYFGPTATRSIIGRALPLWTFGSSEEAR